MSIRTIRTIGDPILRKRAQTVNVMSREIEKLLDDMIETMYHAGGIGLAATQIGVRKRVIVINIGTGLYEMINPEITQKSGLQTLKEGCLSLPGLNGDVPRAMYVTVKGIDRFGKEIMINATGLLAGAFQHEIDHLNGILFTDYLKQTSKYMWLSRQ